jgi:predicted Kef-type K+ transport protein
VSPSVCLDFCVALALAAGAGWLVNRFALHPAWGYVAAGAAVGPFTPGYVVQPDAVHALAAAALALLLVGCGLTFGGRSLSGFDRIGIVANLALVALAGLAVFGLSAALGTAHPLAIAATGGLATLGVAAALVRTWNRRPDAILARSQTLLIVRNTAALALLAAAAITDLRLGLLALAAFAAGVVISEWSEASAFAHAVVPVRRAIGLCLFVSLGAMVNPDALVRHAFLVVIAIAICALALVLAARRYRLGPAPLMTLTVALVPFADFHAALGSAAVSAGHFSDFEQALIASLLLSAVGVAMALCSLSLQRRTAPS